MLTFLFSPLGKIAGAAMIIAACFIGFKVWLVKHDHAVLEGYVRLSEKITAEAKAAEMKRQADAAAASLKEVNDQIMKDKAAEAIDDAEREQEIKDYEAKLAAAQRDCRLSGDDVSTIMHNNKPAAKPLGHK